MSPTRTTPHTPRARRAVRLGGLLVAIPFLGLAGLVALLLFTRLEAPTGVGPALLLLALAAGTVSFFSPCSFPLLASVLTVSVRADDDHQPARRSLTVAAGLSSGAVVFLLAFGALIALAGTALFEGLTFTSSGGRTLRIAIGTLLLLLGLKQLGTLRVSFRWFEQATHGFLHSASELGRQRPQLGLALFGLGYLTAGFG